MLGLARIIRADLVVWLRTVAFHYENLFEKVQTQRVVPRENTVSWIATRTRDCKPIHIFLSGHF
jgi:hypothetical protein